MSGPHPDPSVDEILAQLPAAMKRLHVMTFCTGKNLTVCAESDDDPCPRCKNIRLLAAAARALRAREWQPIETAPKDADLLLLYLDGSGVEAGYLDAEIGSWLAVETQGLTGGTWHATPTHWMPLPAPPKALASSPSTGSSK